MTSRSAVLEKKLHELESELDDVFHLPVDPTSPDPRRDIPFDDIKHRFDFLNTLLSAEAASSQTQDDPDDQKLHDIGTRLTTLNDTFRDWNETRLGNSSPLNNDTLSDSSICSHCTQTLLLNDDLRDDQSESQDDQFSDCVDDYRKEDENVKKGNVVGRKLCKIVKCSGVFGCGIIVGAIFMVEVLYSSVRFVEFELSFLPPT